MARITLIDSFLREHSSNEKQLSIYLINGIQLKGAILNYDKDAILLRSAISDSKQLIFKNAIATVVSKEYE